MESSQCTASSKANFLFKHQVRESEIKSFQTFNSNFQVSFSSKSKVIYVCMRFKRRNSLLISASIVLFSAAHILYTVNYFESKNFFIICIYIYTACAKTHALHSPTCILYTMTIRFLFNYFCRIFLVSFIFNLY